MTNTPPRPRFAGLDGLRAIAVALVVLYHLFPESVLRAGYVGVDVFFVISGFLITSLLIRERAEHGRIRLGRFWSRRARRLLPALGLMVTVCASVAWLIGGDVLVDLGRQVLGAATFSFNWVSIAAGGDYFAQGQPELLRNLWSLAVEEQFYLVWPLLLPLFLRIPSRFARAGAALVLGAGSAAWMVAVAASGGLTRAYFGTDSHAFGLLAGVALAFLLQPALEQPAAWMLRGWVRSLVSLAGAVGLVLLLSAATLRPGDTTVPAALILATVLSSVVLTAGVWPGSPFGRALDVAPLRVIGERSYGIYLWHWPVLVLLLAGLGLPADAGSVPVTVGVLALLLTLVAAEVSFRFLETPVRRLGFRGGLARAGAALRRSRRGRVRVLGAAVLSVALVGGTTAAIAAAPDVSSGEAVVDAGMEALRDQAAASPSPTPSPTGTPEHTPVPVPTATPEPVSGWDITAVGDSVMLASAPALLERFPGIHVDAAVSRSMYAAPGILRGLAESGQLRPYVVVALGTNGPIERETLAEIRDIIGSSRRLVLVNAYAPRSWTEGVNAELGAFARAHHDVQLADWAGSIAPHLELLAGDQIHPGDAGGRVFADAVEQALRRSQESQLRLEAIVRHLTAPPAEDEPEAAPAEQ
ncbi:acyltransferase family protein [Microbacterium sp. GXF7504]